MNQFSHDVWQAAHGLPQNSIQAIVQTTDEYLWLGTQEGLVSFDGFQFRIFDKGSVPGLRNIDIRSLAKGSDGDLWMGNVAGQLFSIREGVFTSMMGTENKAPITALLCDRNQKLWIGTQGNGLWELVADGPAVKSSFSQRLPSSNISALLEDREGNIWIGTRNRGMARLKDDTIRVFGTEDGLTGLDISVFMEDPDGSLWIGTEIHGVIRLIGDRFSSLNRDSGLSSDAISSLCADREGNIWVGTNGGGLNRITQGEISQIPISAVSHRNIGTILVDRENNLWVGTAGGGLNRYSDVRIKTFSQDNGMPADMVWVIYADPAGGVWFGTQGGGVAQLVGDRITDRTQEFKLEVDTSVFLRTRDGDFWIGTQGDGIFRLKDGKLTNFQKKEQGIEDPFILVLAEGPEGVLWCGSSTKGIARFDGSKFTPWKPESEDITIDVVNNLFFDADGTMWIGTPKGLIHWSHGETRLYTRENGLVDPYVSAIHQDGTGALWIGSYGSGLTRLKDGQCQGFSPHDGLIDGTVFKILEDGHQTLWLSSNRGIFSVPISDFDAYIRGDIPQLNVRSFGTTDGMKTKECNHVGPGSGAATPDGIIWLPTLKGAVRVDPDNLDWQEAPPQVHLERVAFNENRQITQKNSVFPPGSSDFEFHFSAPSFRAPDKVRFRFKLEGYDTEWVEATGRRTAYYSSLPPKSFRFVVTAARSNSGWAEPACVFPFSLEPHFYQRPLFYLLLAFSLIAIAFGIHRVQTRAHQKRQLELEKLVLERTEELAKTKKELVDVNQELAENARLSGMAEIASGVLHNIANALNSAGTSLDLMTKLFREPTSSRVIKKIVDLVDAHREDLGHFITHDSRGQKLPAALETLCAILQKNRDVFERESDTFFKQMKHIEEIVIDQKDMGWAQRSQEIVDVNLLIKNALQMTTRRLERLGIETRTKLSPVPLTSLNPSDFLQVIANLLKNACEAIDETPPGRPRRLEIRTSLAENNQIRIDVEDSGPGITEGNSGHIFTYGFTTKPEGHGFGLHYSAAIIKQMDGQLSVRNAGPNSGAVFSILIPIVREETHVIQQF